MQLLVQAVICFLLLAITYMDFKERAIQVHVLLGLFIVNVIYGADVIGLRMMATFFFINSSILILLLLLLAGYYMVKEGSIKKIINHKLGMGDVIFWLCIAPLFSTVNFIFFFVFSLLVVLLIMIFQLALKTRIDSIPLAGHQAVILLLIIIFNQMFFKYNFYIDLPLLNL